MIAAASAAPAQAPSAPLPAPANELQAARDQNQRTIEALAKIEIPMTAEPAFHFKA